MSNKRQPSKDSRKLFHGKHPDLTKLAHQSQQELRDKARAEWKRKNLPQ